MNDLSHFDAEGRARMVDVGGKTLSLRVAVAAGEVRMAPETLERIREGRMAKGDVLAIAEVAAVMGAKRTSDLIPLCHPLALDALKVELSLHADPARVEIRVEARTEGRTGVEMEALMAVSAAALTIYDMCKAIDRGISCEHIRLLSKSGGRSGTWTRMPDHDRPASEEVTE